jgi:hypothetical protein
MAVVIALLVMFATTIVAVVYLRDGGRENWRGQIITLSLSSAFLLILFSARPIDLNTQRLNYDASAASGTNAQELVKLEVQKANDEIKMRIEQEDTWFHYKFLLVGALLASFLGYLGFGGSKSHSSPQERLEEIVGSGATCSVLALACVVALAIDMHIRNNMVVIQQLALWINYYAEPALLQTSYRSMRAGAFIPWEQFLRIPGAGMHRDDLYGSAFYPHLNFVTWVIYVLYLGSLYRLSFERSDARKSQRPASSRQTQIAIAGFALVHLSFGAFTWIAHYVPGAFLLKLMPYSENWKSGATSALIYLLPWAFLVLLNIPYLWPFLPTREASAQVLSL